MPRTRLGGIHSKPTVLKEIEVTYSASSEPLVITPPSREPKVVDEGVEVTKDLRKIPSSNFWVDKNTGLIYLDKAMLDVL